MGAVLQLILSYIDYCIWWRWRNQDQYRHIQSTEELATAQLQYGTSDRRKNQFIIMQVRISLTILKAQLYNKLESCPLGIQTQGRRNGKLFLLKSKSKKQQFAFPKTFLVKMWPKNEVSSLHFIIFVNGVKVSTSNGVEIFRYLSSLLCVNYRQSTRTLTHHGLFWNTFV